MPFSQEKTETFDGPAFLARAAAGQNACGALATSRQILTRSRVCLKTLDAFEPVGGRNRVLTAGSKHYHLQTPEHGPVVNVPIGRSQCVKKFRKTRVVTISGLWCRKKKEDPSEFFNGRALAPTKLGASFFSHHSG